MSLGTSKDNASGGSNSSQVLVARCLPFTPRLTILSTLQSILGGRAGKNLSSLTAGPSTPRSILKAGPSTPGLGTVSASSKRNVTFSASTTRPASAECSYDDDDDASVFASLVSHPASSRVAQPALAASTSSAPDFGAGGESLDSDLFDVSAPVGFSADIEPQTTLADSILTRTPAPSRHTDTSDRAYSDYGNEEASTSKVGNVDAEQSKSASAYLDFHQVDRSNVNAERSNGASAYFDLHQINRSNSVNVDAERSKSVGAYFDLQIERSESQSLYFDVDQSTSPKSGQVVSPLKAAKLCLHYHSDASLRSEAEP
jgi:hypothetical protein